MRQIWASRLRSSSDSAPRKSPLGFEWRRIPWRTSHVRLRPLTLFLQPVDYPEALFAVLVAAGVEIVEFVLANVTEGRVSQIVSHGDRLCEVFVEVQCPRNGPRDLGDFKRVRQPGGVVVTQVEQ